MTNALTVGVFDGVHVGHAALLHHLSSVAAASGRRPLVATFDPHPRIVLSKGNDQVKLLTTVEEKERLLRAANVATTTIHFTRPLSDLTAEQFLRLHVRQALDADLLVMGYNHHFGCDNLTPEEYDEAGERAGVRIVHAQPVFLPDGRKVSSSDCRRLLLAGDVETAQTMLGRPYQLAGPVVPGDAIGRTLGFPTLNVEPPADKLVPANGVYVARATTDGGDTGNAVVYIGSRPTLGGEQHRVEAHLIDPKRPPQATRVALDLLHRLRPEARFDDTRKLAQQIARDIEDARNFTNQI